jgi:hypothetical protein
MRSCERAYVGAEVKTALGWGGAQERVVFCDDPVTCLCLVEDAVWVGHTDGSVVIRDAEVARAPLPLLPASFFVTGGTPTLRPVFVLAFPRMEM